MIHKEVSIRKNEEKSIFLYYGNNIGRASIFFICGIILGVILTIYSQTHYMDSLKLIVEKDLNVGVTPKFSTIFTNNIIVGILLALGILWGRLLSQVMLLINGAMLGIIICSYYYTSDSAMILISLLPHSVLEIFCLLICGSIGMSKYKKYKIVSNIIFIGSIISGYMIAAVIEVFVSYKIAQFWT